MAACAFGLRIMDFSHSVGKRVGSRVRKQDVSWCVSLAPIPVLVGLDLGVAEGFRAMPISVMDLFPEVGSGPFSSPPHFPLLAPYRT